MQQIPDLFQEGEETWYEFTRDLQSNRTLASDSQKDWRTYVDSFVEKCSHIAFCRIYTGFHLLRHTYISFGISCNCHTYTRACTHTQLVIPAIRAFEKFLTNIYTKHYTRVVTRIFDYYTYCKYIAYMYMRIEIIYIYKIQNIYIYVSMYM